MLKFEYLNLLFLYIFAFFFHSYFVESYKFVIVLQEFEQIFEFECHKLALCEGQCMSV